MIKKCKVCGNEFITYPSKIKIGRGKYCSRKCCLSVTCLTGKEGIKTRFVKGQKAHNFKGWQYTQSRKTSGKYITIYCPDHPFCTKKGMVREQRLIMEKLIGRYLRKDEIVHHLNGDSLDNRIENLKLMLKKEHDSL